ncbi:MAG: hypothetical protein QNJ41_12080 [Xenococcaceae cyanobacterium MO_188.B32]|nr:hypothetical protein [Xenococcaceae cyanobacterium MO_188.B32]
MPILYNPIDLTTLDYNNTISGLAADKAEAAIDEVVVRIADLETSTANLSYFDINPFGLVTPGDASGNNAIVLGSGDAEGENSIVIGSGSTIGLATNSIAIGDSATVGENVNNAVQLGSGTNNASSSFQFLTNTLANAEGLYTSHVATNYVPADEDNVTSHFEAIDTKFGTLDGQIAGGVTYKGGYDAGTNAPDLDTAPSGVEIGDMYTVTVDGQFFTIDVTVGDVLIAEADNASTEAEWTIVNRNIDETASQIGFDNTTSGATSTEVQGAIDEAFASIAQLNSTAETALIVGTEQTADFTATIGNLEPVDCTALPVTVTPPPAPAPGDKFAVVDSRANSATNNIIIDFATAGQNLYGTADTFTFNEDGAMTEFKYLDATIGWIANK